MKNKHIYIIIAISIFVFSLIFIIFSNCSQKKSYDLTIESVNKDRVFYPNLFINTNKIYYLSDLGIIWYEYDLNNGQKKQIVDDEILSPEKINYSEDGKNAVVYSNYPEYNIKHYDFVNNKSYNLNQNITYVIWDSIKPKIFYNYAKYLELNKNNNTGFLFNINESDYSGDDWRAIKDLSDNKYIDTTLYSSNDENYIYYLPLMASENIGSTLYKLFINTKQDEKMTEENSIFSNIIFSPNKSKIAYLNNEEKLVVQDIDDKNSIQVIYEEPVNIEQIAWGNNNEDIYIVNDLNNLIQINIKNASQKQFSLDNSQIDYTNMLDEQIKNLGLSQDDKTLYFTYNAYIYKVDLTK